MRKPYKTKHAGQGDRKAFYADRPLLDYIQTQADEKRRKLSAEIVELLELGIRARDGAKSMQAIRGIRKLGGTQ